MFSSHLPNSLKHTCSAPCAQCRSISCSLSHKVNVAPAMPLLCHLSSPQHQAIPVLCSPMHPHARPCRTMRTWSPALATLRMAPVDDHVALHLWVAAKGRAGRVLGLITASILDKRGRRVTVCGRLHGSGKEGEVTTSKYNVAFCLEGYYAHCPTNTFLPLIRHARYTYVPYPSCTHTYRL